MRWKGEAGSRLAVHPRENEVLCVGSWGTLFDALLIFAAVCHAPFEHAYHRFAACERIFVP